nr:hypothetical protein [uncultured Lichenicoccus sp.]
MHTPTTAAPSLPYEFVGLARQAIAEIDADHRKLIAAARAIPRKLVEHITLCGNLKRKAALAELDRRLPLAPYVTEKRTAIYRSARACRQPLSDQKTHDGIELCWLSVGLMRGDGMVTDRPASLFIGLHAAGRLLQRTWPRADIRTAIYAAHDTLLHAPEALLLVMEQQRDWLLPIDGGAFACDVHVVRDQDHDTHLFLRAHTFLAADHLKPDQHAQVAAMLYRDGGRTMLDGLCQPPQLRQHIDRATV